jgi:hypothetical protein
MAGLGALNDERRRVGIDEFAMECCTDGGKDLHPEAFFAKVVFASRSELFELLEQRLGSPFLDGRETLQRSKWITFFENAPNSWSDFIKQVFKLVEVAIMQCHQDVVSIQATLERSEVHAEQLHRQITSTGDGKKSSKKARKKDALKPCSSNSIPLPAVSDAVLHVPDIGHAEASSDEPTQFFDISTPVHESSQPSFELDDLGLDGACLQGLDEQTHWSTSASCASHSAESQSTTGRLQSLWLDNGQFGSNAAWQWIVFESSERLGPVIQYEEILGLKACVTNVRAEVQRTFLNIVEVSPVAHNLRRSRSAP